ncbi:unnamed protein product, partial [Owenia fusiformis]
QGICVSQCFIRHIWKFIKACMFNGLSALILHYTAVTMKACRILKLLFFAHSVSFVNSFVTRSTDGQQRIGDFLTVVTDAVCRFGQGHLTAYLKRLKMAGQLRANRFSSVTIRCITGASNPGCSPLTVTCDRTRQNIVVSNFLNFTCCRDYALDRLTGGGKRTRGMDRSLPMSLEESDVISNFLASQVKQHSDFTSAESQYSDYPSYYSSGSSQGDVEYVRNPKRGILRPIVTIRKKLVTLMDTLRALQERRIS